jgi:hypothetical protein
MARPIIFISQSWGRPDAERQASDDHQQLVSGPQQGQGAADGDEAGPGEKGGAVLQRGGHLRIHHAHLARQQLLHALVAIAVHHGVEAAAALCGLLDQQRIGNPGAREPGESQQIGQSEGGHERDSRLHGALSPAPIQPYA